MKQFRKALCLALAAMMLLALAACGGKDAQTNDDPAQTPKTLTIGTMYEADSLDPQGSMLNYDGGIRSLIFDQLFEFDMETQDIKPMIATDYTWADDVTLDINIRDDVYSSEGTHLTANDVLFCLKRGAACTALTNKYGYFDIAASEVTGDYSLRIKLVEPFANAPFILSLDCFAVYCEEDFNKVGEEGWARNPITTGPYKLEIWAAGDSATVVKNEHFWGGEQSFDSVSFKYITDVNALLLALQSGDIDFAHELAMGMKDTINNTDGLETIYIDDQRVECLWFNSGKAPFDNAKVIRALEYALDKEAMLNTVYLGNKSVGDGYFNSGSRYYAAPKNPITHNAETAKAMLADAGYPDGFEFTVIIYPDQSISDMLLIAQNNLKQIGVTMNIETLDFGLFFEKIYDAETLDAYSVGLMGYVPDDGFSLLLSENIGSNNTCMYNNPEFDELYHASMGETDSEKRADIYRQLNEILRETAPFIPLVDHEYLNGMKQGLTGFNTDTLGNATYRNVHYK